MNALLDFLTQIVGGGGNSNYGGFGGRPKDPPMTTPPFNPDAQQNPFDPAGPLLKQLFGGGGGEGAPSWNPLTGMGLKNNPALGVLGGGGGLLGALFGSGGPQGPAPAASDGEDSAPPSEGEDITVEADGWKPRKQTVLGALADAYLSYSGEAPAFQINRDKRSMTEAMEGFQNNPERFLNRISKMPGMQDEAWKMYNEYSDNKRQAGNLERQNRATDLTMDRYLNGVLGNMANVANEKNWPAVRAQMVTYGNKYGRDLDSELPKEYDPELAMSMVAGVIPAAKQQQMEDNRDYRGRRLEQIDDAEGGRNARSAAGIQATDARTERVQDRQDKRQQVSIAARPNKGNNDTIVTNTKYGKGFVKGNRMEIIRDGMVHRYVRSGDKWVPHSQVPVK